MFKLIDISFMSKKQLQVVLFVIVESYFSGLIPHKIWVLFHKIWIEGRRRKTLIHVSLEVISQNKKRIKLWLVELLNLWPLRYSELNSAMETTSQNNLLWSSLWCHNSKIESCRAQLPSHINSPSPQKHTLHQYNTIYSGYMRMNSFEWIFWISFGLYPLLPMVRSSTVNIFRWVYVASWLVFHFFLEKRFMNLNCWEN